MKKNKNNSGITGEKTNEEFRFEIIEHIGILGENPTGWKKELNIVKWNNAMPKLDIREWDAFHEKMSRGASLNEDEAKNLKNLLVKYDFAAFG